MADSPLRLAENVTLLQKVNSEPGRPSENAIPCLELDERALKLRHERDIADCLAFVSTYSNDPNRIMALCIEEKPNRQGLIVSVAANAGNLDTLTSGMRGIVSILENEARDPIRENYPALLRRIVVHGRSRLLRRLSSSHTPPSMKALTAPVATRLKDALTVFYKTCGNTAKANQGLTTLSEKLQDQFNQLEQMPAGDTLSNTGEQLLTSMLITANSIWMEHKEDLAEVMEQIPCENSWIQNDKEKFMLRLRKLAHYISTTKHLLKAARTFPILKSIEVRGVSVAPLSLATHLQRPITLPSTGLLNRYLKGYGSRKLKATMTKLQQLNQCSLPALQSEVRNRVCRIEHKVHAEIQLLFYYEEHSNTQLKPRVIVSNKSACFLCNLFLKQHGGFYTPRTHGKLYDTWTLPNLAALQVSGGQRTELRAVVQEFNIGIEQTLINSIETGAVPRLCPNESDVFSIAPFTPSAVSAVSTRTVTPGNTTSIARSMLSRGADTHAPASILRNSSPTYLDIETIQHSPVAQQATLHGPTAPEISSDPDLVIASSASSSSKPASVFSIPVDGRRNSEESSSQPPELAASPITPTTPTAQMASLLPLPSNKTTPEPPKRHKLIIPEIILLQQGAPSHHTFTQTSPPLRLHTPRIHIELSYAHARGIMAQSAEDLYSNLNEEPILTIEAEWLAPTKWAMVTTSTQAIDLASEWKEMDAPEGVMYGQVGLLLRKGRDFVALKARESLAPG